MLSRVERVNRGNMEQRRMKGGSDFEVDVKPAT
jgi:hypothetical protein